MKALLIMLALLVTSAANAGVVHGTITAEGKPVKATTVTVACDGDEATFTATTNERGRYSLNVQRQGKCMFRITYQQQALEHKVFSYPDPVQYDFIIVKDDGGLVLRRK